jgi:adenylyltransferase/sulfurtransferase
MAIIPGETACLRCLVEDIPDPGTSDTCDTAGVIGPAVNVVASLQVVEALKLLSGQRARIEPVLTVLDVWDGSFRRLKLEGLPEKTNCPACVGGERVWLRGERGSRTTVLCGRNAVQLAPSEPGELSLPDLAERLREAGEVSQNPFLLRLRVTDPVREITVFRDGRAIITGTEDLAEARTLYARFVGH